MSITELPINATKSRQREPIVSSLIDAANGTDWLSIFERDPEANSLQHPDYVLAECDSKPGRSSLKPAVIQLGCDQSCEGLAILIPKSVTTTQVGGLGPQWQLLGFRLAGGSFLTQPGSDMSIQSRLLAKTVQYAGEMGAQFLLIEDLDEQSLMAQAIQAGAAGDFRQFAARAIQKRWRIRFPENEDDYWKTFTARTRSKFRARLKKFGHSQLERITRVDQLPGFLRAANEISSQSWQSRQFGLRIRNDESELKQMSVLAEQRFLRSYLWNVEGQPAAFAFCHQRGGCFRYEEIAYRAEYAALSPGVTLLQQMIEDFYRHDTPAILDFGGGDAEYKQKFGNSESQSQSLWLVPPTLSARSTLGYLNACRCIRQSARNAIKSFGLATKARQWLRRGTAENQCANASPATTSPDESGDQSQ